MKKLLTCVLIVAIATPAITAQESKKEAKERHKNYWKKVGTDTRDFWKGEHEKKMKKKAEKEHERAEQGDRVKNPGSRRTLSGKRRSRIPVRKGESSGLFNLENNNFNYSFCPTFNTFHAF